MPLIHRDMIDMEKHVIPLLRELGYRVCNDSTGGYVVLKDKIDAIPQTIRIEITNGCELLVTGDEALAQLLVDKCKPFGKELTVYARP